MKKYENQQSYKNIWWEPWWVFSVVYLLWSLSYVIIWYDLYKLRDEYTKIVYDQKWDKKTVKTVRKKSERKNDITWRKLT